MKIVKKAILYYGLGIVASLVIIGLIHLFGFIFEDNYCYADWDNIILNALISGIPLGLSIWSLKSYKSIK